MSQQKSIETASQDSETKFRATFEQAAVGMALVSRDGKFFQLNQKLCEITGYSEAELLCLSLYEITHPDDLMVCEVCQTQVDRMLMGHLTSFEVEKRYIRKNGQIQWIKMTVSLIRDLQKTSQHFLIVIEDIQSRKEMEEHLSHRLMVEKALASISQELINETADVNQILKFLATAVQANRSALVRCQEDPQNHHIFCSMSHEWCDTGVISAIAKVQNINFSPFFWWMKILLQNQPIIITDIIDLPERAEKEKTFLLNVGINAILVVPIFNSSGKLWGQIGFDLTDHRSKHWTTEDAQLLRIAGEMIYQYYERQAAKAEQIYFQEQEMIQRQELARSNDDLEQFAYIVSHDLQAPLATIVSYAQLLERYYQQQLDDKAHKYLGKIIKGTRRMSQQINDLLTYSSVSTQKQSLQVIDLNLILQEAITNLQYTIEKNQATIHVNYPLPTLKADSTQLLQLLQNLIGNAIKYRKAANPEIYIKVIRKKACWLFSISDNGIGIAPKDHEKIFQIFQRLHTQQEYPGTGIGLAICQRIVHRYQGSIWVESKLGEGSTFYFTIADL